MALPPIPTDREAWHALPLTQGKVALVDTADLPLIADHRWFAAKAREAFYAHSNGWRDGRGFTIRMHRLLMQPPHGMFVDHINGDGLDNRRSNLRLVTSGENSRNQKARAGTSRFRGVSWNARSSKWTVIVCVDRRNHFIGQYCDEVEAARAYDAAALRLHGAFARPNFQDAQACR